MFGPAARPSAISLQSFPAACRKPLNGGFADATMRARSIVLIFIGTLVTLLSVFGGYALEGG
ncbi:MAG: Flagellar motor rotation protein MotA [uncultured Caballeronia sp.]|nr:MAG: Flagellar motor rotation protein MotA [uncultured Caballeronia sp.]